ncbi:Odorant receptor 41 [Ephemera danica]|nr:Odorant receptor 41 [Ephemera danica]
MRESSNMLLFNKLCYEMNYASPNITCSLALDVMEVDLNLTVLRFAGFPDLRKSNSTRRTWFWINLIQFLIPHILMVIYYLPIGLNVYSGVNYFFYASNCIFTITRWFYFMRNNNDINIILNNICEKEVNGSVTMMKRKVRSRLAQRIRRYNAVSFSYLACCAIALIGGFILYKVKSPSGTSLKPPRRILLFGVWWFTDWHENELTYVMLFLWEGVVLMTSLAASIAVNALICALLLAVSARANILSYAARTTLMPNKIQRTKRTLSAFRSWICKHQRYLSTLKRINIVFGPMILLSHFEAIISIIAFSYMSIKVRDQVMSALCLAPVFGSLLHIFLLSKAGQEVIDMSVRLSGSVMSIAHLQSGATVSKRIRSILQVLTARLSVINDRASGLSYFTVSLGVFTSILNACVSYLLVLLSFRGPENEPEYFAKKPI